MVYSKNRLLALIIGVAVSCGGGGGGGGPTGPADPTPPQVTAIPDTDPSGPLQPERKDPVRP